MDVLQHSRVLPLNVFLLTLKLRGMGWTWPNRCYILLLFDSPGDLIKEDIITGVAIQEDVTVDISAAVFTLEIF